MDNRLAWKLTENTTFYFTTQSKVLMKYCIACSPGELVSLLFSRTCTIMCCNSFSWVKVYIHHWANQSVTSTLQCIQKHTYPVYAQIRAHMFELSIRPLYTVGLVPTGLSQSGHIYFSSSSHCPTVFVIILELKLCMRSPVWCVLLSFAL